MSLKLLSVYFLLQAKLFVRVSCSETLIPKPPGPYNVGLTTLKLVDHNRIDPFQPNNQSRALMVSAFYPTSLHDEDDTLCPVQYMPPITAALVDQGFASYGVENGTFESLKLQVACASKTKNECLASTNHFPVVLFSPGATGPRLIYSAIAQYVSSKGFIVVTIDHPGDAEVVEFPDGTLVFPAYPNSTLEQYAEMVEIRAQDAQFVLDALSQASIVQQIIPGARSGLDVRKALMFGHSLGGATSLAAAYKDPRFVGVVDIDGRPFGPVISSGIASDRYFLLFESPANSMSTNSSLPEMRVLWDNLKGWKRELLLQNITHLSYTDMQLVAHLKGEQEHFAPFLGSFNGARLMEILTSYLSEFFELSLGRTEEKLLKGPSNEFPEVLFPVL